MSMVICEQRETMIVDGGRAGGSLWASPADFDRATGWALKPEGLCRDDICIPVRDQQRRALVRGNGDGARINLPGLWQHMGHTVASDDAGDTWVLGVGAETRAGSLLSLEAPDFELPDLAGRRHSLGQHRGKKVFLTTWASW